MLLVKPRIEPPLDPGFRPAALALARYRDAVRAAGSPGRVILALEREGGVVARHEMGVFEEPSGPRAARTLALAERVLKFLLWSRGARRVWMAGPAHVGRHLRSCFTRGGARSFDVEMMERVYERPFEVRCVTPGGVPEAREPSARFGGHFEGCRIGFDLGASDYKVAALRDGEPVHAEELPWRPGDEPDPRYHLEHIRRGLERAASRLPRVDAIGGSSAGVLLGNRPMAGSLFRAVPPERFEREVKPMFQRLGAEWGVPLVVANDGDVAALAGTLAVGSGRLLGIAMGSSEAAGYADAAGHVTGAWNELAFAPLDLAPGAPVDEWSGDRGVGAQYLSQQAVGRLGVAAGIEARGGEGLAERLTALQEGLVQGDVRARRIFETIGVYLGYAVAWYAGFYEVRHVVLLGRVTSGAGGGVLVERARGVLEGEFPDLARGVRLHLPREEKRRVAQAIAAASLPEIRAAGGAGGAEGAEGGAWER